ncbi:MAG: hypothetical protein OIF55_01535 [Amphritea sp.]|nr:hypothetical protein [Amphritea sp.]
MTGSIPVVVDLIRDAQPWTRNQIRKRSEAVIHQVQTHGDEDIQARVSNAHLLGMRDRTLGEAQFLEETYLPQAQLGGMVARQAMVDNEKLKVLIGQQQALADWHKADHLLNGDEPLATTVEQIDDDGNAVTVDNPAYLAALALLDKTNAELQAMTADDWRLLAQRLSGAEIDDATELHLAVVRILPTIDLLETYVEGEGLASVDKRKSLANARQAVVDVLVPAAEVVV